MFMGTFIPSKKISKQISWTSTQKHDILVKGVAGTHTLSLAMVPQRNYIALKAYSVVTATLSRRFVQRDIARNKPKHPPLPRCFTGPSTTYWLVPSEQQEASCGARMLKFFAIKS